MTIQELQEKVIQLRDLYSTETDPDKRRAIAAMGKISKRLYDTRLTKEQPLV